MLHKKVELTELFYDLVYVYTISQLTSLIHHLHHGVVSPHLFFVFAVGLVIFVNSWMVQTVFTNRFGKNSLVNILFMFLQMMCLFVSSNAITQDWETHFTAIFLPMALISLLLLAQYILEYIQTKDVADRYFIRQFFYILGLRSGLLLLAVVLPQHYLALWVAVIGILSSWVLPALLINFRRNPQISPAVRPVNFPHLVERLSLLVIITFGETIIGIADYFKVEELSLLSVLVFLLVTNLFMMYIVEIDHLIDTQKTGITGNGAIYAHYLIFFGLSLITVSLNFIGEEEAQALFAVGLLYAGIFLVTLSLLLHNGYNKKETRLPRSLQALEMGLLLGGFALSFLFLGNRLALLSIAFLVTTGMMVLLVGFNLKRQGHRVTIVN